MCAIKLEGHSSVCLVLSLPLTPSPFSGSSSFFLPLYIYLCFQSYFNSTSICLSLVHTPAQCRSYQAQVKSFDRTPVSETTHPSPCPTELSWLAESPLSFGRWTSTTIPPHLHLSTTRCWLPHPPECGSRLPNDSRVYQLQRQRRGSAHILLDPEPSILFSHCFYLYLFL